MCEPVIPSRRLFKDEEEYRRVLRWRMELKRRAPRRDDTPDEPDPEWEIDVDEWMRDVEEWNRYFTKLALTGVYHSAERSMYLGQRGGGLRETNRRSSRPGPPPLPFCTLL